MACMDDLAEDTLHYEIMPYLTYEERINFNQSLRPIHRRNKKLTKKQLLEHSFVITLDEYTCKLNLHNYYNGEMKKHYSIYFDSPEYKTLKHKSLELIYKIVLFCTDDKVIKFLKMCPSLHEVVLQKSKEFKNPSSYVGIICTKEYQNKLIYISKKLYNLLSSDINMKDYYKILNYEIIHSTNIKSVLESLI